MSPGDNLARSIRNFAGVYAVVDLLVLIAGMLQEGLPIFYYFCKPLVMTSLSIFFFYQMLGRHNREYYLMQGAILFSLMGDIFLMFQGALYFQLGLGSFLIAQILYISVFSLSPKGELKGVLRRKPWLIIPFLLYAYSLLYFLFPYLGELLIPVTIYAMALMTMALAALNRWRKVRQESFAYVFAGSLLFMISDSLIAINRFAYEVLPISFAQTWIMLTYMAAQYGIVIGMLIYLKSVKRPD